MLTYYSYTSKWPQCVSSKAHMLHVWNIYQHLPHKWPSFVGKYTSTMEHMGRGFNFGLVKINLEKWYFHPKIWWNPVVFLVFRQISGDLFKGVVWDEVVEQKGTLPPSKSSIGSKNRPNKKNEQLLCYYYFLCYVTFFFINPRPPNTKPLK